MRSQGGEEPLALAAGAEPGPDVDAGLAVATARRDMVCEPVSARTGRDFLRAEVAGWDVTVAADQIGVLELLVSELVTNAVLHAGTALTLTVERHPCGIRVSVHDLSTHRPVMAQPDETSLGGRGLALIDALADSWGVDDVPGGKTVWFYLLLPTPTSLSPRPDPAPWPGA